MTGMATPPAGTGFFARLVGAITKAVGRLNPARVHLPYLPERHYMRGGGPKSKQRSPAGRDRTPKAK